MGCRKNLSRLTIAERVAFTNAVNQLRSNGGYDDYVEQHRGAMGHGHGGPAFFPWHREFLRRFEDDLQAIDPSVSIPYWDWTQANVNPAGTESLVWRDDFMGGPGAAGTGAVTTGPFASWGLVRNRFDVFGFPGTGGTIGTSMSSPDYTTFRSVEGPHGAAHVWVGGFMGNPLIAPRDPVFWLLHANVDRLWSEWITRHAATAGFQPFLPLSGGPLGHNLTDSMWPWNGSTTPFGVLPWTVVPESIRPADLVDHRALDYFYDTVDPECRPVVKVRFKELKDRLPKELKERLPKELKERLPKESKERLPKELAPKEVGPKESKEIREIPGDPFIRPELRPDLSGAALQFEPDPGVAPNPDVAALGQALSMRREDLHRHG
ncbi:tyrosinase family protein [Citricoccus sp. SGAir0253]|uniref:tyrosinase family protein n=1 Tax=Citricoccus sp. SGAir0253 TaxID=2567881 RepID=UPI0010CD0384|nr:tyrosinase family protein [Citricoccus sp. SGAir0253]QCU77580.1 tyrosinase family protein [Citricoccus sp. SGAir0253]